MHFRLKKQNQKIFQWEVGVAHNLSENSSAETQWPQTELRVQK